MKNTSKFQNVVIVTIVGWLVLFVFLPNLMIDIGTSFLTVTTPVSSKWSLRWITTHVCSIRSIFFFEVLLHSLNMALIATLACLVCWATRLPGFWRSCHTRCVRCCCFC